jgi:hypothetical protein
MKKFVLMLAGLMLLIPTYLIKAQEIKKPPTRKVEVERPAVVKAPAETQFFCGYCHVLTYPEVLKRSHKTWKADEDHNDIGCVECHYPPDMPMVPEHRRIPKTKAEAEKKKKKMTEWEYMKTELEVLSRLTTIVNMEESTVVRKSKIDDRSCTTSECHPTDRPKKKEGEYWAKKLKFTEYEKIVNGKKEKVVIPFTHKEHYDKDKWVEGQEMHCTTCHRRETNTKHFEVSKESCNLCHFKYTENPVDKDKKDVGFAKGRAECKLCHKIPEEPFKKPEKPEEKPVTHEDLEKRKVSCADCHLELVQGNGQIKQEKCLDCHENTKELWKDVKNKKVMHKEHVAKQTAACFNCHEPIVHKKPDKPDKKEKRLYDMYVEASLQNCKACHEEPHVHQAMLLAGRGGKGVDKDYPIKHHDMKTNCLACHKKEAHDDKGRKIKAAEEKTCVDCHEKESAEQMKKWKKEIADSLKRAREVEKEVIEAIKQAKGKLPEKAIQKAEGLLKAGQENLRLVDAGGGSHNKKYAELLLEIAEIDYFEAALTELKPKK